MLFRSRCCSFCCHQHMHYRRCSFCCRHHLRRQRCSSCCHRCLRCLRCSCGPAAFAAGAAASAAAAYTATKLRRGTYTSIHQALSHSSVIGRRIRKFWAFEGSFFFEKAYVAGLGLHCFIVLLRRRVGDRMLVHFIVCFFFLCSSRCCHEP